jgi:hypothetical protein
MPPALRQRSREILSVVACVCACGRAERPPAATSVDERAGDSLALTGPNGLQVWFTLSRSARSADGAPCVERGLEIRGSGRRVQVPLLYTGETPTLLNDSTMRAMLWTDCRPVSPYRVDLRTGQPVPETGRHRTP